MLGGRYTVCTYCRRMSTVKSARRVPKFSLAPFTLPCLYHRSLMRSASCFSCDRLLKKFQDTVCACAPFLFFCTVLRVVRRAVEAAPSTLFSLLLGKDMMDNEEAFRGGLLSPGPSASAPSVKNDDTSVPNPERECENAQGTKIEDHTNEETVTKHSLQPTRGSTSQKRQMAPRSVSATPKRALCQTPFKKPPRSTSTMRSFKTPSSRSMASSSFPSSCTPTARMPVKVHILDRSDRDKHPYLTVKPKYTCTLNLISNTKPKEVCLHAAEQVRRKFDALLDGTSFEVRDKDGHLFSRADVISEALVGDALYLIENAVSSGVRELEKDELSRSQVSERSARRRSRSAAGYRTPSSSSRTSSSVRRLSRVAKSEPRMELDSGPPQLLPTPSIHTRRNSELQLPVASEEVPSSKLSATTRENSISTVSGTSKGSRKKWAVEREPSMERQQETKTDAMAGAVASQQSLPSPESSPAPQNNTELIIPDSQERPVSPSPSPNTTSVKIQLTSGSQQQIALLPSKMQPPLASPARKVDTSILTSSSVAPRKSLPSRPDPYDISTVLSDDENYSPRLQKTAMSSFMRKLGSSRKRASTAAPRLASLQPLSPTRPCSPSENERLSATDQAVIPSTPARPAATPKREDVSSPAVPLPSSPTNHVVAAMAKVQSNAAFAPKQAVDTIYDSSDDVDESIMQETSNRFSSSTPSQISENVAHWSGPPRLQLSQAASAELQRSQVLDPFWAVRSVGRRPSAKKNESCEDTRNQMRRLGELGGSHATRICSGQPKPQAQATSSVTSLPNTTPQASLPKKQPPFYAGRYPLGLPPHSTSKSATKSDIVKSPVIEINDSSTEASSIMKDESSAEGVAALSHESSPSKNAEIIVISDTSSRYDSDEEDLEARDEAELPTRAEKPSPAKESPAVNELLIDTCSALPIQEAPQIPLLRAETSPFPTAVEKLTPSALTEASIVAFPYTDPFVQARSGESPPSAQPSKRRRELSEEPDSTEEDRRKKARREERRARKLQRRKEKEEKENSLVEERKRVAAEQARLRAQRLETIVSSPSKAAELSLEDSDYYESDDESDEYYDQAPMTTERASVADFAVVEEDDDDEFSSSPEVQGGSSLGHSSKRHLLESLQSDQKSSHQALQPTTPTRSNAAWDPQPKPAGTPTSGPQFEREIYDDWAFLEAHLGRSQVVMDVHDRIHMKMMHQGIRHVVANGPKNIAAGRKTLEAKSQANVSIQDPLEDKALKNDKTRQLGVSQLQAGAGADAPLSKRCPAPSPKADSTARGTIFVEDQTTETRGKDNQKDHEKQTSRKERENPDQKRRQKEKQKREARRQQWRQHRKKRTSGSFKQVRRALVKRA